MKNRFLIYLFCLLILCLFLACTNNNDTGNSNEEEMPEIVSDTSNEIEETEETFEVADGYEKFGNEMWQIGGLYYNDKVVDIKDNDSLAKLYGTNYLSFDSEGQFLYINSVFYNKGTYTRYENDSSLLKIEQVLQFDTDKGEFVENESCSKTTYILTFVDENSFQLSEFDSLIGQAKADDMPLIFVKSGEESKYITDNKINIGSNDDNEEVETKTEGSSSYQVQTVKYQSIFDEYTEKMQSKVSTLVSEYKSETAGISNTEKLAEICNDKIGDLAEVCNEGVGKMADLMYANDDEYSTYEEWAIKLQDDYTEIANDIWESLL